MGPRTIFVLDTGPLLEFIILSYQLETHMKWWAGLEQLHALKTKKQHGSFREMLRRHRGRIRTSSGVVAELQAKIRKAEKKHRPARGDQPFGNQVWSILCREFQEWGVGEDSVALRDMQFALVAELGPVDVSLIELAKKATKEGSRGVVLTNDNTLIRYCRRQEVSAELVTDELERFRPTV